MEPITSRTSHERIIRAAIFMVLVDVFTVMYLWDGHVGYPQQNRAELARLLGVSVDETGSTIPGLQARDADSYLAGRPLRGKPTIIHGGNNYFLGPGGWLQLGVIQNGYHYGNDAWTDGPRKESDIRWQRYIGWTLAVVGFFATLFFARVLGTRAVLSDQGLQLTGKPIIRWEEIAGLRADPGKRGVVELEYESKGSRRTLRLDDYLYRDLTRITAGIAAKKSLNDPLASLQKA